jgi:hypothetical protein
MLRGALALRSELDARAGRPTAPPAFCMFQSALTSFRAQALSNILSLEQNSWTRFRLACQAKIEGSGEVIVRATARKAKENVADLDAEVRKEFVQLPLQKKIATLLQLEAITMSEALNAAIDKPLAFGSRAFDKLAGWSTKSANQPKK